MSRAVALLERALGFRLTPEVIAERRQVRNSVGRLTRSPLVKLVSVKARIHQYVYSDVFGSTNWTDIPIESVVLGEVEGQAAFRLPCTIFGGAYDEALVEYVAGYEVVPDDLQKVLDEIEQLAAEERRFDEEGWTVLGRLSEESWLTIRAYKGVQTWRM